MSDGEDLASEYVRRQGVAQINGAVESDNKDQERKRLEAENGQVWDTTELSRDFEVLGFCAPCVVVRRKADGVKGSLFFQHNPRLYYGFEKD
jgi:hypothetical protein